VLHNARPLRFVRFPGQLGIFHVPGELVAAPVAAAGDLAASRCAPAEQSAHIGYVIIYLNMTCSLARLLKRKSLSLLK
jgi:hypothetical protein